MGFFKSKNNYFNIKLKNPNWNIFEVIFLIKRITNKLLNLA